MVERVADRKAELLDAAVRVFAEKGFHASRVGDIATEAGVAHGLLYHYFRSKDDVLDTVFRDTWSALVAETRADREARTTRCASSCGSSPRIYLGAWLQTPDLVRVLVREVARGPAVGSRVAEIGELFDTLARIIEGAQARGEARADIDPTIAAWALYGAHEEILTGWVLGRLPGDANDVDRAVTTVVDVVHSGLAA